MVVKRFYVNLNILFFKKLTYKSATTKRAATTSTKINVFILKCLAIAVIIVPLY